MTHGADLDDALLEVLEARLLVVAQAAARVAAVVDGAVDVVGGDAHDLGKQLGGEGAVLGGEGGGLLIEVRHGVFFVLLFGEMAGEQAQPSLVSRPGTFATASSAMIT